LWILISLLVAGLSLGLGIIMQSSSLSFVIMALMAASAWLIWMLLKGISLPRLLILVSLIFLMPMQYAFYFALALLLLVFVADRYHLRKREIIVSYPFSFLILMIFGGIALSKTFAPDGSLYFVATVVVPVICFLVIGNSRRDKPALDTWMRMISLVAMVVGLYGIYIALRNPTARIGSTWSNAMTINGFYGLAFFFSIALAFKAQASRSKVFWIATAIIIFLGMLFTYTRMAMLAVVFGLGLLILKYRKIRTWGLIAIALIPLLIPSAMLNRGEAVSMIDMSILIRFIAWYNAFGIIRNNLFTGIGFSTWKEIYQNMIPLPELYAQHAHNVYINLLVGFGLFGTVAYLAIIFRSLRSYYQRAVRPSGDIVAYCLWTGMLSLMFACLTDIFIQQYQISLLFWITLALMVRESEPGTASTELDIAQE
jgi:O-antigen ligase